MRIRLLKYLYTLYIYFIYFIQYSLSYLLRLIVIQRSKPGPNITKKHLGDCISVALYHSFENAHQICLLVIFIKITTKKIWWIFSKFWYRAVLVWSLRYFFVIFGPGYKMGGLRFLRDECTTSQGVLKIKYANFINLKYKNEKFTEGLLYENSK